MEQTRNLLYIKSQMKSRLFPDDELFWELLAVERRICKSHKTQWGGGWSSSFVMDNTMRELRKLYLRLYKTAYLSGYNRIKHETELAAEITKDIQTILDENNLRHDGATLLWRLIQDEPYFISAVHNVLSYHNAAFEEG